MLHLQSLAKDIKISTKTKANLYRIVMMLENNGPLVAMLIIHQVNVLASQ